MFLAAIPRVATGKNSHAGMLPVQYPVIVIHQWVQTLLCACSYENGSEGGTTKSLVLFCNDAHSMHLSALYCVFNSMKVIN